MSESLNGMSPTARSLFECFRSPDKREQLRAVEAMEQHIALCHQRGDYQQGEEGNDRRHGQV